MAELRSLLLSPLLLALGACATFPSAKKQPTDSLDKLVTDSAAPANIVENSVLRTETEVALALRLPRATLQIQVRCSGDGASWLYIDAPNRIYGVGKSQYREPIQLAAQTARTLGDLPQIQQACAKTPDWRKLTSFENNAEGQILLDIASLTPQPDGSLRLWAAFDSPSLAYDPPYQAPYGSKAEQLEVNCQRSTYTWVAGYDLDQSQRVTDGRIEGSPSTQSFTSASADYRTILQAACKPREQLSSLALAENRDKPAPDLESQPELAPGVVDRLASLGLTAPKQSLTYLRTEGSSTFKGKTKPLTEEFWIQPGEVPGLLRIKQMGSGYVSQKTSFMGMVQLSSVTHFGGAAQGTHVVEKLELEGNWKQLPVGEHVAYRVTQRDTFSMTGQSRFDQETRCDVTRELAAAELNSQLVGRAKEIKCSVVDDEYKRIETRYYLEDYGLVFSQGDSRNEFYYSDSRITRFR